MRRIISLWNMPYEVMLIIGQPTNVFYRNQVGGNACLQMEIEGALAAVDMEETAHAQIMGLFDPYASQGITSEIAAALDAVLASQRGAQSLRVDRRRVHESCEAWVYVVFESPPSIGRDPPADSWLGFGAAEGVLTWPNSD